MALISVPLLLGWVPFQQQAAMAERSCFHGRITEIHGNRIRVRMTVKATPVGAYLICREAS